MKQQIRNVFLLVMVSGGGSLTLVSCAADPATWQKPNTTAYDGGNAAAACQYEIAQKNYSADKEQTLFSYCMKSKGFRLVGGD